MASGAASVNSIQPSVGFSDGVEIFRQVVELTKSDDLGRPLSLVGILLLFFAGGAAYKLMRAKPDEIPFWHKIIFITSGAFGVMFLISGPSLSLYLKGKESAIVYQQQTQEIDNFLRNDVKPETVLDNLNRNQRVTRFIRFISFDPKEQPELSLERLLNLGPTTQHYTFVADYEELRGYTAAEALRRSGIRYREGNSISAVIFPADQAKEIIPVNARGLMQVIDYLESKNKVQVPFNVSGRLRSAALENLKDHEHIDSWSWSEYRRFYSDFCEQSHEFRCNVSRYSVASLMGNITHDWHPLGFAEHASSTDNICNDQVLRQKSCDITEWPSDDEKLKAKVGSRVFMIPNVPISTIRGRVLVDFSSPSTQKIPSLVPEVVNAQDFFAARRQSFAKNR